MFFGFNSIYHRNVFIPFSHFPKRPPIATQSLKGGAYGALAGQPIDSLQISVAMVDSVNPNQRVTLVDLDHNTGNTGHVMVVER
jgi:hypothetical protein